MGRIKNSLIKRTARLLLKEENSFTEKFEDDKKLLGSSMPSKRLRNRIAGYVARLKQQENERAEKLKSSA